MKPRLGLGLGAASLLILVALAMWLVSKGVATIGMRLIPAGEFSMGSADPDAWPEEGPVHRVRLTHPYYLDEKLVTNAQFRDFVSATAYRTVAERPIDARALMRQLPPGTPAPAPELLQPGALVFVMPVGSVDLRKDISQWWRWTPGAHWAAPEGPGSRVTARMAHPVVQLAWEDAVAYCQWAGKRLPTEAEWERAARGGEEGQPYVWGRSDPYSAESGWLANIWQGKFPSVNSGADGSVGTSPVGSYAANRFGLYDMSGNVWEWVADWFDPAAYSGQPAIAIDPAGPADARNGSRQRVQRGGSFMCDKRYCTRYRVAARQGAAEDSGTSHAGLRCARDAH